MFGKRIGMQIALICVSVLMFSGCGCQRKGNVLFKDDFSNEQTLKSNWEIIDARNPTSGPSQWVVKDGSLYQKSNIYRGAGGESEEFAFYEGTHAVVKQGSDWDNYKVNVDFKIKGDDDGVGVLFRYTDEEHFYRFIVVQDPSNRGPFRRLQAKDGDKYVTLAETKEGYDTSADHNIKVIANGENFSVIFNGKEILSAKDARYPSGRAGLMVYAEQPVFDNFIVTVE